MTRDESGPKRPGRFSYEGLERAIHEKARLGILTSLMVHPRGLVFSELKELCSLTDGNLNRHLAVLQAADLIEIWKAAREGRQQTLVRLTESGRQRFMEYLGVLEKIVTDAAKAAQESPSSATPHRRDGWSPA